MCVLEHVFAPADEAQSHAVCATVADVTAAWSAALLYPCHRVDGTGRNVRPVPAMPNSSRSYKAPHPPTRLLCRLCA